MLPQAVQVELSPLRDGGLGGWHVWRRADISLLLLPQALFMHPLTDHSLTTLVREVWIRLRLSILLVKRLRLREVKIPEQNFSSQGRMASLHVRRRFSAISLLFSEGLHWNSFRLIFQSSFSQLIYRDVILEVPTTETVFAMSFPQWEDLYTSHLAHSPCCWLPYWKHC